MLTPGGVTNTVACLDEDVTPEWQAQVRALKPGPAHVALYVGLEGDVRAAGATGANVWIYESDDIGRLWHRPADEDSPALFVSFPALKDPACTGKPTAEVLALCDGAAFAPWIDLPSGERPAGGDWFQRGIHEFVELAGYGPSA